MPCWSDDCYIITPPITLDSVATELRAILTRHPSLRRLDSVLLLASVTELTERIELHLDNDIAMQAEEWAAREGDL